MIVIALRQLHGNYGTVAPGGRFSPAADVAGKLLARGLVRLPQDREIKVVTPSEQKPGRSRRGRNQDAP